MNSSIRIVSMLAAASCTLALAAGDDARIRAGTASWMSSFNSGNAAGVVALYADNAVLMPPNAPSARGVAAIKDAITQEIAGAKKAGITLASGTGDEVGIAGDMAWHAGSYFVNDKSGKSVDKGKFLEVWERKGGKWRIVRDIWNSSGAQPAPAPAPAAAPKKK